MKKSYTRSMSMVHSDVQQQLLKWFPTVYKDWFIFQNSSGYASAEHVHYGVPSIGGGFDYICWGGNAETQFIEVKTDGYPGLSKNQKTFAKNMTSKGFKCWVYREHNKNMYLIPALEYRPSLKGQDGFIVERLGLF